MSNAIRNCTFAFKCDKTWESLNKTNTPDIRFCDACQHEVFWCNTKEQLAEAIALNRCIAISIEDKITRKSHKLMGKVIRPSDTFDDDLPF